MNFKSFSTKKVIFFLLIITLIFYIPILTNTSLFLERGNDLEEFFWPSIYYVKNQILIYHNFPLWNYLILSGTPLLPDPQSPLFYIPNIIFLLFPIDTGFLVSAILHSFVGGIGLYFCCRNGFELSKKAAIFAATFYITSPKISGVLEAGHIGILNSFSYIPFVLLAILKLSKKPNIYWVILFSFSLSGIFFSHSITFLIILLSSLMISTISLCLNGLTKLKLFYFLFSFILTFGLVSIALIPQLEWSPNTTRFLLLEQREVFPKWSSKKDFFFSTFLPWIDINKYVYFQDSEKWLTSGTLILLLAWVGFFRIKSKIIKLLILFSSIVIILLALNNASPFYGFLLNQDWYTLIRISTRFWIVITLLVIFLTAFAIDKFKNKSGWLNLIYICIIAESLILSWIHLYKPVSIKNNPASQGVYEFIKSDSDNFRVFCTNFCLSQKQNAINSIQTIEGYNTLIQKNYYKQAWQLTQSYWNYYTLYIPPIGIYLFEKLHPDPTSLGDFNTKYIISPYQLENKSFEFKKEIDQSYIYLNTLYKSRAYYGDKDNQQAPILNYSPNFIRIDTSKYYSDKLILADIYSPGWNAYLNGKEKIQVEEKPDSLRLIKLKPDTKFVDIKYEPKSFILGLFISLSTLLLIILTLCLKLKNHFYKLNSKL